MAAWVIREEREGEPLDAFQLEEMEVPEPGAFEVTVRVMAAGRELQQRLGGARPAGLGLPLPRRGPPHRRLRRLRRSSGRSARASPAGSPATRSSSTATRPPTRIPRSTASTRSPRRRQQIWGYETTWGSFAQFCKVQAQQLLPKPKHLTWEEAASYGLTYFTAYRMLIDQADLQAGHRVLIWGAAGGLGVFAHQLVQAGRRRRGRRRLQRREGRARATSSARRDYVDRNEYTGMMRRGGETPDEEKARFKESRRFCKHVAEQLGGAARHRLRARRPGHVPDLASSP